MKPLLKISHLDKQIGTLHLQDISFTLEPGYIFGLIGRNGSGKTSLIRTILNLYHKDSGAINVNGCPMDSMEHEAKDQIGFVLDEFIFEEKLSVSANGRYFGSTYSKYDHSFFLQFCERFNLDPKQKTGRLSKGQKTRSSLLSPSPIRQSSLSWMNLPQDWIRSFAGSLQVICRSLWKTAHGAFSFPHI